MGVFLSQLLSADGSIFRSCGHPPPVQTKLKCPPGPCSNFGCYILCLTCSQSSLYANRKGTYCIYQTEYSLFSVSYCKSYTKQRLSKVYSATKIFMGGQGDGWGGGNSERGLGKGNSCLWKKRGTDGVIAQAPAPFSHTIGNCMQLHHADSLKLRLSTSNRNR